MKKLMIVLLISAAVLPAFGEAMDEGAYETRLGVLYNFADDNDNKNTAIQGALGYYFWNDIQMGAFVSFDKKGGETESFWGVDDVWGLGVFGEYNVQMDSAIVPFLGVSAGLLDGDQAGDTVYVIDLSSGVKCFVTDTIAIAIQLNLEWASDDIYNVDRDPDTNDILAGDNFAVTAEVGIRIALL